jgi:hypothetical protein
LLNYECCLYNGADRGAVLLIFGRCEGVVEVLAVQQVACEVFLVLPALGALGVLQLSDPPVLFVLDLGSVRRVLISGYVRE